MEVSWLCLGYLPEPANSHLELLQFSIFLEEWVLSSKCTGKLLRLFSFSLAVKVGWAHVFLPYLYPGRWEGKPLFAGEVGGSRSQVSKQRGRGQGESCAYQQRDDKESEGGLIPNDVRTFWLELQCIILGWQEHWQVLPCSTSDWTLWNQSHKSDVFLGGRSPRKMLWDVQQLPMKDGIFTWHELLSESFSPTTLVLHRMMIYCNLQSYYMCNLKKSNEIRAHMCTSNSGAIWGSCSMTLAPIYELFLDNRYVSLMILARIWRRWDVSRRAKEWLQDETKSWSRLGS